MSFINPYHKTRLAPTPSGFLHLGNVLSFAVTAALARKTGAKLLLRIDDLDQPRVNKLYVQDIFDTLIFLEIPWDEGPRNPMEFEALYSQIQRMAMYNQALQQLAREGKVFACTCSRSQLKGDQTCQCFNRKIPLNTQNASWRLITGDLPEPRFKSYSGEITRASLPSEMENFVVKKKDGFPAYQLTSLIDDLYYGVDLIVRGEDLWPSTLAQHVLAKALGRNNFGDITFYHHSLLVEADGKKLSKSAGALSVKYLRESGKTPADVFGLIAAMTGIEETVANWEQLATAIIKF